MASIVDAAIRRDDASRPLKLTSRSQNTEMLMMEPIASGMLDSHPMMMRSMKCSLVSMDFPLENLRGIWAVVGTRD